MKGLTKFILAGGLSLAGAVTLSAGLAPQVDRISSVTNQMPTPSQQQPERVFAIHQRETEQEHHRRLKGKRVRNLGAFIEHRDPGERAHRRWRVRRWAGKNRNG